MPAFSQRSLSKLETCHEDLQKLFKEVVKHFDCTITEGRRDKASQDEYFRTGKSKVEWPNSKHNAEAPDMSRAVDVAPYPIDWKDKERFYYFAGVVQGIAMQMDISIRWGGDWDQDTQVHDQTFFDLPHFELND